MSDTYEPPKGTDVGLDFFGNYAVPKGGSVGLDFPFNRCRYIYYKPPQGSKVGLNFSEPYTPPIGNLVGINFTNCPDHDIEPKEDQFLHPTGFDSHTVGGHTVERFHHFVYASDFDSSEFGQSTAYLYTRYVVLVGFNAAAYGRPSVENLTDQIWPRGFANKQEWGKETKVWNLLQILKLNGVAAAYPPTIPDPNSDMIVRGGVKHLPVPGFQSDKFSKPTVINTTAEQFARPSGIQPEAIPRPNVSPRFIYTLSINPIVFDGPLVQFPPMPKGWESSRTGQPDIDYWTKNISPTGLSLDESLGYPVVRDRAQRVLVSSVIGTGVFGDTILRTTTGFIRAVGKDHFEASIYNSVRSNKRGVELGGFIASLFGGGSVFNKTPSVSPLSINPIPISPHSVGYWVRSILTRGNQLGAMGRPALKQTPSISPKGFTGEVGDHTIWPAIRYCPLTGFESLEFFDKDETNVWFRVRTIEPFSKLPEEMEGDNDSEEKRPRWDSYGKPKLEYANRLLKALGSVSDSYGKPNISNLNRTLSPASIFEEYYPVHIVGGLQFIKPLGYIATKFGTRIIPPIQTVYPRGFANPFGVASLQNKTVLLMPTGFASDSYMPRWGANRLFNTRQYVDMYYDPTSLLNPPAWPRWTLIENKNKVIGAFGASHTLYGNPSIYLNARVVSTVGIQAPATGKFYMAGMVSHGERTISAEGMEPPYISGWATAYNDAFLFNISGFNAEKYGTAILANTRRYYNWIGGFKSELFGTPMVADKIRSIKFEPRYSIAPPRIQLHTVDLHTRYIDHVGFEVGAVSLPSLSIHFKKIHTRWTHIEFIGWPALKNVTPELGTRGRVFDEYGTTSVRLEWRPMYPDGSRMDVYGKTTISDVRQFVFVNGLDAGAIGSKLMVIKGKQPPFTDQLIDLSGNDDDVTKEQVPAPSLNQNVLHAEGFVATMFGQAFGQSNTIIIELGMVGEGHSRHMIGLRNRVVSVESIKIPSIPSAARLSPHTIWATKDTPDQAKANHVGTSFEEVDGERATKPGAKFGSARVSTYHRVIRPRSLGDQSSMRAQKIELKKREIKVKSIISLRMGWAGLSGGTRDVKQFASTDFMRFPEKKDITVKYGPYYGPITITLSGIPAPAINLHRIEYKNRTIVGRGFHSYSSGRSANSSNPYMWQGMRIGPLMPTIPEGFAADKYGEAWVSYRVREARIEGFESFISEYDLENFDAKMDVRNAYIPVPPKQELAPVGIDIEPILPPNIALGAHYILPDGNADQYRKGAF